MVLDRIDNDSLCHNQFILMQGLSLIFLRNQNLLRDVGVQLILFQDQGDPILLGSEVINSLNLFIKICMIDILTENLKWKYKRFRSYQVKMSDLDLELNLCSAGSGADQGFSFLEFCPTKCFYFEEDINTGLGSLKNYTSMKIPNFRQQCQVEN